MTGQNRSAAVMQQRSEPHDSLDDFPTPPWATRALLEFLQAEGFNLSDCDAIDPCANRGHMVAPMREYFYHVDGADLHDYGEGFPVRDYLFGDSPVRYDWSIFNPPFRLAEQFILRGIGSSWTGCAALVRSSFAEGASRYRSLFHEARPSYVVQFSERVVMHKGRLLDPDRNMWVQDKDGQWIQRKPSTATSYCWMVWAGQAPTKFDWFPPGTRKSLTRPGDYPAGQEVHPEETEITLI